MSESLLMLSKSDNKIAESVSVNDKQSPGQYTILDSFEYDQYKQRGFAQYCNNK